MVRHARDFAHDHANVLASLWRLNIKQPLRSQCKSNIIDQRRDVIQTISIRNNVIPGPLLAHFLEAAMEVADFGFALKNLLTIKLEVELNGAVRGGMRWPHLQGHHLRKLIEPF